MMRLNHPFKEFGLEVMTKKPAKTPKKYKRKRKKKKTPPND